MIRRAWIRLAAAAALATSSIAALALSSDSVGTFVAIDDGGQPTEKILRVSQTPVGWKFEDRQADGSWLDVSCHGGCEHRESQVDDLVQFFGAPPPPDIRPECVQNEEYAFCHFLKNTPGNEREGFVLVVRINDDWMPVSMLRLPEPSGEEGKPAPKLESARWVR